MKRERMRAFVVAMLLAILCTILANRSSDAGDSDGPIGTVSGAVGDVAVVYDASS
jgi:hypothetical protein